MKVNEVVPVNTTKMNETTSVCEELWKDTENKYLNGKSADFN